MFLRLLNSQGDIEIEDRRFIEDDLAALVDLGLLPRIIPQVNKEKYVLSLNHLI